MRNDSLRTPEKGVILLPENIKSALLAPILFPAAIVKKFFPVHFSARCPHVARAWLAPYRSICLCAAALCRCIVCACRIFARTLPAYLSAPRFTCRPHAVCALPKHYLYVTTRALPARAEYLPVLYRRICPRLVLRAARMPFALCQSIARTLPPALCLRVPNICPHFAGISVRASFYVPPACRLRFAKALPARYHPRFACACRHILSVRHLLISAICLHPFEPRRCFPTLGFTHFSCTIFRFMSY